MKFTLVGFVACLLVALSATAAEAMCLPLTAGTHGKSAVEAQCMPSRSVQLAPGTAA
ncbi:hypothetical protein [Actinacidiphila acididurans]|nr:hypothetical protein [Actinacidiphila acididurans]